MFKYVMENTLSEILSLACALDERLARSCTICQIRKKSNKAHVYRLSNGLIIARSSWTGYSRRNIAKMTGNRQLTIENSLLVSLLRSLMLENRNQSKLIDGLKRTKVSILA